MCSKTDCAMFNDYGICNALTSTNFGDRECPFYKKQMDAYFDRVEAAARCAKVGIELPYKGPRFASQEEWIDDLYERGILV